jgi:hypothetical protein
MHVYLVTTTRLEGYFVTAHDPTLTLDDQIFVTEMEKRGHQMKMLPWNTATDLDSFEDDAVFIIRSPWDYQMYPTEFRRWLDSMHTKGHRVLNHPSVIHWNLNKRAYLQELTSKGISIAPTIFTGSSYLLNDAVFEALKTDEIVVKPEEGAGAWLTFRIHKNDGWPAFVDKLRALTEDYSRFFHLQIVNESPVITLSNMLIQPFLPEICEEGEWSLVYFGGNFSHGFLKKPNVKDGDFRVQEEHGGSLHLDEVPGWIAEEGRHLLELCFPATSSASGSTDGHDMPLYIRVDGCIVKNTFLLMELELFEPELYFRADPQAAERLAVALENYPL